MRKIPILLLVIMFLFITASPALTSSAAYDPQTNESKTPSGIPFTELESRIDALLALSVGFLAAAAFSLKGAGVRPRRKVLFGITVALLAISVYVFWDWNFFVI